MKLHYIIPILFVLSCNKIKNTEVKIQKEEFTKITDEIFKQKVFVILSDEVPNSSAIILQNYVQKGKSFTPVFTSEQSFKKSKYNPITNKKIEISGILLLATLKNNEILKFNPGLPNETEFQSTDLIKKYSNEIDKMKYSPM
ncbi:hypothetical protein [Flavobacterium sp. 3HN19-14]|uniref:hypothetical protein n=1 Tax=Flavobacterium sp. 3HN19-14 TaxID=3448133 RepID=UPI003EE19CE3